MAAVDVDGGPALKGVLVSDDDSHLDPAIGERVIGSFDAQGAFRWVGRAPASERQGRAHSGGGAQ